jgi:hypothetical protein
MARTVVGAGTIDHEARRRKMMTTAEAVEGMADAGLFEILAARSLRELDDDCRAVAHFGVNEAGKTIANPVDGFCRVPSSDPPRFVMLAFTLTAREGLERKWLFDHTNAPRAKTATAADDGDLIKATREVASIRAAHPTATFIVYLCTNRRLDTDLMHPVYDAATRLGVEVRFLDQSRLRDFLDANPVGQWLRQEHLRIQADQVSLPLLQHISKPSVEGHAAELLLASVDQIVPTAAADHAATAIRNPAVALHLLVGPSGVGKSVIGQDLLRRHTAQGGASLWIPGEVAETAATLAEGIEKALCSLHPRLGAGAGQATLRLVTTDHPLLLVIDDINRSNHPTRLLQKLIGWSRPPSPGGGEALVPRNPVRIVCPVWDSYWMPLRQLYESLGWIRWHGVGAMTRPEAMNCLRHAMAERAELLTSEELDGFAECLGDDPILLGLFGRMLREDPNTNPNALAEDVLGRLVARSVGELALRHSRPDRHYASALKRVAKEMIREKALYPSWADLELWLRGDGPAFEAVGQLAAQGHVCRLIERGGVAGFEFRHDRILEHHLAAAAAEMVCGEGDDPADACDPFFTTVLGRAAARTDLPEHALDHIETDLPNSLVAAVPFLPLGPSSYANRLVRRAKEWLARKDSITSRRWDALRTLADSRSPRVLEVTEGVTEDLWLLQARLRNGDALAGSRAFAISRRFHPASSYAWLESLIGQAKAHHFTRMVDDLCQLLAADGQDDQARSGALCLAGYLGDPRLAEAVRSAWAKASDRQAILLPALWAGLRCSGQAAAGVLGPMMDAVLDLLEEEGRPGYSSREALLAELRFTTHHGFAEPVLVYLVELGRSDERHRGTVLPLLYDIDHPIAIGYVARELAAEQHRAEQGGGVSFWSITWGDRWRRRDQDGVLPLSATSLAELRRIWEDGNSPDWLRDYTFTLWSSHVHDLSALQAVPDSSRHIQQAVWQRALLGDREVVPRVLTNLTGDRRWLQVLAAVWTPEVELALDAALNEAAGDPTLEVNPWANALYTLSDLLRDIPADAAERLLTRHWGSLRRIPLFIQVALYLATPGSLALAEEALASGEVVGDPFRHIDHRFGFFDQGRMDRLTERHLATLRPYLDRVSDICLDNMTEFCRRFGLWGWAIQYLEPECRRRAQTASPEHGGGPADIVRVARHWFPTDEELLGDLDQIEREDPRYHEGRIWAWWEHSIERGDPVDRPPRLLGQWLRQTPSLPRFKIVSIALRVRGSRKDLDILRGHQVEAAPGEARSILADVEFAVMRRSLD